MGAYAYCAKCGMGLHPTLRDKLKGRTSCKQCGTVREWDKDERENAIDELCDSLEELTKRVNELDQRTAAMIRLRGGAQ
jgi:uncharacterized Zn finger protein (UPF0148 family)